MKRLPSEQRAKIKAAKNRSKIESLGTEAERQRARAERFADTADSEREASRGLLGAILRPDAAVAAVGYDMMAGRAERKADKLEIKADLKQTIHDIAEEDQA